MVLPLEKGPSRGNEVKSAAELTVNDVRRMSETIPGATLKREGDAWDPLNGNERLSITFADNPSVSINAQAFELNIYSISVSSELAGPIPVNISGVVFGENSISFVKPLIEGEGKSATVVTVSQDTISFQQMPVAKIGQNLRSALRLGEEHLEQISNKVMLKISKK